MKVILMLVTVSCFRVEFFDCLMVRVECIIILFLIEVGHSEAVRDLYGK